jgi:hypothetical protein
LPDTFQIETVLEKLMEKYENRGKTSKADFVLDVLLPEAMVRIRQLRDGCSLQEAEDQISSLSARVIIQRDCMISDSVNIFFLIELECCYHPE